MAAECSGIFTMCPELWVLFHGLDLAARVHYTVTGRSKLQPSPQNYGFNTVHGRVNVVSENIGKIKLVPALSVGFIAGINVKNVGGAIENKTTTNGDI
jgi:hypothetical protein